MHHKALSYLKIFSSVSHIKRDYRSTVLSHILCILEKITLSLKYMGPQQSVDNKKKNQFMYHETYHGEYECLKETYKN